MQLALDNMVKCTELEDTYQDAASNVLVAICKHSWQAVAQHLETELLTGIFPHRSLFYVMGVLSSHGRSCPQHRRGSQGEILGPQSTRSVNFLNTWSKELLEALTRPSQTQQDQCPEKTFLFTYYGLILQAADDSTTVRTHLQALLETSHQWPEQREGIALTVGLAAAHHLDDVWAVLDQFGRSRPVKRSPLPGLFEDLQWKWASSTILLAYGQMAARAKAHILPWVDNILSRMIFYFRYSSWDENLKQSFLLAVMMLVKAISRREGAHSYEFSQTSQLLECLIVLMEKESPGVLCTTNRQQAIHIASKLCELRPPIDKDRKSRLLSTCFRSVFALPLMDTLERHTCLFLEPPNIQVKSYSACSAQGLQGQGIGLHLLLTTAGETACMKGPWPPHSQGWGPKQFLIVLGLHFST
uniref:Maestro heat like repeat family member 5 (gene/pseudogene) n=1 Tax=Cavia porcellus TaxID=10141 RepID=A0A286XCQ4_CAVPO